MNQKANKSNDDLSEVLARVVEDDSWGDFCQGMQNQANNFIQKKPQTQSLDNSDYSISSDQSSIISKLTIDSDAIRYKVNIIAGTKYRVIGDEKEMVTQIPQGQEQGFKKKPVGQSSCLDLQDKSKDDPNSQPELISIEDFIGKEKSWDKLDKISKSNPGNEIDYMLYRQILQSQFSAVQEAKNDEIRQKIVTESEKNPESIHTIVLALGSYLKSINPKVEVTFCQKSTLKSQVSIKVISTGFAFHKFKCLQIIKQRDALLTFQEIMHSPQEFEFFEKYYRKRLWSKYKIKLPSLKISAILKLQDGVLGIEWDTFDPEIISLNQKASKRIKVTPFFDKFFLSVEDFDHKRGNIKFPNQSGGLHLRGRCPYYLPQKCSRFSIQVWDKFDSGDNEWLEMKNSVNEWYSAFFGLLDPKSLKKTVSVNQKTTLSLAEMKNSIDTAYSTSQKTEEGIICTPYMWNALQNTFEVQINGNKYCLVFQCRVNPKEVKITEEEEYWMVHKFCHIRPYGIILVKKEVKDSYPKPQSRFKKLFSYQWLQELKSAKIQ